MLDVCGSPDIENLVREAIPKNIFDQEALEDNLIGDPLPEHKFL